ncbi:MAG: PKD domain-containing protein, partial [Daejeonella sp.]
AIISSNNVTTLYKGGLIIGKTYLIRVSGSNSGTFKLCINNYNPIVKPGQDCSSASTLCSKESFTQTDVSGAGLNNNEAAGTCLELPGLATEQNSAWYKWTAADNGTLTFVITPTANDDIDWVLFDLGPSGSCDGANPSNAIRCNAARGVDCSGPGQLRFNKTGLDLTSVDLSENGGCQEGQDGFVRYVDMIAGHVYGLLVNNFDRGNNGFTLEFGGTGEFLGPTAEINFTRDKPCTVDQNYTFTASAANYETLRWTFGDGASIDSADTLGPFNVSYATPGIKTIVLQAFGEKGCSIVATKVITVGLKPEKPLINLNQNKYCLADTIILSTPLQNEAIYQWTGPGGFSSNQPVIYIPVTDYNVNRDYTLSVTINECTSDPSNITVPPISQTPVINLTVDENNPCTPQFSYTVNYNASDFQELRASFGPGVRIISGSGNGPYTITYTILGTKTITVTATSISGCSVTSTQIIDVPIIPDKPIIQSNKPAFCLKDTIELTTNPVPNVTYLWQGPNNFRSSGPSVTIVVSDYNLAGKYTLTAIQGRCSTTSDTLIIPEILKNPVAEFTSEPDIPAKLSAPVLIKFTNRSQEADSYLWDFGDGSTSTEENPSHLYTDYGEFNVTLTAFKADACDNSIVKGKFVIRENYELFIPNTFTPNGDQINDEFVVTILNLKQYKIQIFNRYGTLLFLGNNIFDNWKGIYKNEPLPVGTYFYIIDATDINDEVIKKSGPITLLR